MCFVITYLDDDAIIESTLLKDFNWQVMEKMVPAISKVINEKNCHHILLDWRKAKIALSTTQIYDTPNKLKEEFEKYGVNIFKLKRAYLIDRVDSDSYFFETMMKNNSQTFSIFLNRDEAVKWLKS
ncbi:hypothetical protein hrd7_03380 [Leptolinea sp. HRD-7]|nr:hypothetical protein hrd7_03380 [Leptolinea sp. HRD-7]